MRVGRRSGLAIEPAWVATAPATRQRPGRYQEALERTPWPGVYRRGSRYVVVYRADGRQRKEAAATLAQGRELKLRRAAEESNRRRGPTLSLLAEAGAGPKRLQRWLGHHSAGFTLDTYGHLIEGDLGPGLDLGGDLEA